MEWPICKKLPLNHPNLQWTYLRKAKSGWAYIHKDTFTISFKVLNNQDTENLSIAFKFFKGIWASVLCLHKFGSKLLLFYIWYHDKFSATKPNRHKPFQILWQDSKDPLSGSNFVHSIKFEEKQDKYTMDPG